jgi:hypothetical protein
MSNVRLLNPDSAPFTAEPLKEIPSTLPERLVKNVNSRKLKEEYGGDDGGSNLNTGPATSGN